MAPRTINYTAVDENFDPNSHISEVPNTVTGALLNRDEEAFLYEDIIADILGTDFTMEYPVYLDLATSSGGSFSFGVEDKHTVAKGLTWEVVNNLAEAYTVTHNQNALAFRLFFDEQGGGGVRNRDSITFADGLSPNYVYEFTKSGTIISLDAWENTGTLLAPVKGAHISGFPLSNTVSVNTARRHLIMMGSYDTGTPAQNISGSIGKLKIDFGGGVTLSTTIIGDRMGSGGPVNVF